MRNIDEVLKFIYELRDGHVATNSKLIKAYNESHCQDMRQLIRTRIHIVNNLNKIINYVESDYIKDDT